MKPQGRLLLVLVLALSGWAGRGGAAASPVNGITVSPAIVQVTLATNQAEQPLTFQITNHRPQPQTVRVSTADFNSLEDTGGLVFVGANPTDLEKKYGLAKWLNLSTSSLNLAPGQTTELKLTILNQPDLAAGGHYGALFLSLDSGSPAAGQVNLSPIASPLIFVNKQGGDVHSLSLDKVDYSSRLWRLPTTVSLHLRNSGNTHVVPRGSVQISDSRGHLISKGVINPDSAIVLPERERTMSVPLNRLSLAQWPGTYKLEVDYRFDGYDNFRTYQRSLKLWLPPGLVLFIISAAVLAGLLWRFRASKLAA